MMRLSRKLTIFIFFILSGFIGSLVDSIRKTWNISSKDLTIFYVFIIGSIFFVSIPIAVQASTFEKGEIDVTHWDFDKAGLFPLRGEWEFYWKELIEPAEFEHDSVKTAPIYITPPTDLSNVKIDGKTLPADGYGTLHLKVHLDQLDEIYGLKNNYISSSYKVWINGKLLGSAGEVATDNENFKAVYFPMESFIKGDRNVLDIVIHVSNFHHCRVRIGTFYLGTAMEIEKLTNKGIMKDSILFGSLLLISVYHLTKFRKKSPSSRNDSE